VVSMYQDRRVIVATICCDDDASTRSMLKWSNADHMKNNNTNRIPQIPISRGINAGKMQNRPDRGRLPAEVPEPRFVADPNHRKKVLTGELIALVAAKVNVKATMNRMDSTRLGKSFGYMIRQLRNLREDQYCDSAKAVLEHHFDCHTYCGQWCPRRHLTQAQLEASDRYYRSKTKDAALYTILSEKIMARFITLERLKEVGHSMDTQVNESFNNTVAWIAPKNKVYCGTQSLMNRLSVAIGINKLGLETFYKRLYKMLGISMTNNINHFLQVKDAKRTKRLIKKQTKEAKKARLKRRFDQIKEDEAIAKRDDAKRNPTPYKTGQNMADGEEEQQVPRKPSASQRICGFCGLKGHTTTRARACLQHDPTSTATARSATVVVAAAAAAAQPLSVQDIVEDMDAFDALPLALLEDAMLRDGEVMEVDETGPTSGPI
jgi:hypothetical protein